MVEITREGDAWSAVKKNTSFKDLYALGSSSSLQRPSAEMLVSYTGLGAWREGLLLEHGIPNDRHPRLDRRQTQAESLPYAAVN